MEEESVRLADALRSFSVGRGADLFGVADLSPARDAVLAQGGSTVAAFPSAVSLGMRLSDVVVDGHVPTERPGESLYWHHVYAVVSNALDLLANDVARWLVARGHRALAVPASMPYDPVRLQGIFSHKLGAHLAGLGWIGKSCLLVTDRFGPRVRFATVLTDAPLKAGSVLEGRCGGCRRCVDACPVGAFTGVEFSAADERSVRFDASRCRDYRKSNACGMCVASCPRGSARRQAHASA